MTSAINYSWWWSGLPPCWPSETGFSGGAMPTPASGGRNAASKLPPAPDDTGLRRRPTAHRAAQHMMSEHSSDAGRLHSITGGSL